MPSIRELVFGLLPNAAWDGIKYLWTLSGVVTVGSIVLLQNFIGWFLLVLGIVMLALTAALQRERGKISIKLPANKSEVRREETVRGVVKEASTDVQVLVYSNDYLWHKQPATKWRGLAWSVDCTFGDNGGERRKHSIIAICPNAPVPKTMKELPKGVTRSKSVVVYRREN